jgi:hypothetical protein
VYKMSTSSKCCLHNKRTERNTSAKGCWGWLYFQEMAGQRGWSCGHAGFSSGVCRGDAPCRGWSTSWGPQTGNLETVLEKQISMIHELQSVESDNMHEKTHDQQQWNFFWLPLWKWPWYTWAC